MKKSIFFLLVLFTISSCSNNSKQSSLNNADRSGSYGSAVDSSSAIPVDSLTALLAVNKHAENITVKGNIVDCCQGEGCWMRVQSAGAQPVMVRMKNSSFSIPKDCAGKQTVFTGNATLETVPVEDLKSRAADEGKSQEEINKIKEPQVEPVFEATGVLVRL